MKTTPFFIHALSPLHVGIGQSAEVIDLPIARQQATKIPFVPGSSLKGVLRDRSLGAEQEKILAVFGPETNDASKHAGALMVGDARLLALPVRSFCSTFVWATSPLLLSLARRDLENRAPALPTGKGGRWALVSDENVMQDAKVYLEDLDLNAEQDSVTTRWAEKLDEWLRLDGMLKSRFVVLDDDTMSFLYETATQVDTRVRIDGETGTVARGALWIEESLPPETLLVGLAAADPSRRKEEKMSEDEVLSFAFGKELVCQIGGNATVGRGRCRVVPLTTT